MFIFVTHLNNSFQSILAVSTYSFNDDITMVLSLFDLSLIPTPKNHGVDQSGNF